MSTPRTHARELADVGVAPSDALENMTELARQLERELNSVTHTLQAPPTERGFDQEALDRASWELQGHFGREGSIYGIKACEEIARIALAAYRRK